MKSNFPSQYFLISHQVTPFLSDESSSQPTSSKLSQFWDSFVNFITRPVEIKVHKKFNPQGEVWWEVYDPHRNVTASFGSEQEVRIWLEQRYYD